MRKVVAAVSGLIFTAVMFVAPATSANAAPAKVACGFCNVGFR